MSEWRWEPLLLEWVLSLEGEDYLLVKWNRVGHNGLRWHASVKKDGETIEVGWFRTAEEARGTVEVRWRRR